MERNLSRVFFIAMLIFAATSIATSLLSAPEQRKVMTRVCVQSERTSDNGVTFGLTTGVWVPIYSDTCVRWVPQVPTE